MLLFNFKTSLLVQTSTDSLLKLVNKPISDKDKVDVYNKLSFKLILNNPDTALYYAKSANLLANNIKYTEGIINSFNCLADYFLTKGNFDSALVCSNNAIRICKQNNTAHIK